MVQNTMQGGDGKGKGPAAQAQEVLIQGQLYDVAGFRHPGRRRNFLEGFALRRCRGTGGRWVAALRSLMRCGVLAQGVLSSNIW